MAAGARESRDKLLDATLDVVRAKGFNATRVEDICDAAGLTKGSFFHHFDSKDALAIAAAGWWRQRTNRLFAAAPFNAERDPLQRLFGYLDMRQALVAGELSQFTCFPGTVIQETYATHPKLREACAASFSDHVAMLTEIVAAAKKARGLGPEPSAHSLALHIQATLQGGFVMAKAHSDGRIVIEAIEHLRRYLALLFGVAPPRRRKRARAGTRRA